MDREEIIRMAREAGLDPDLWNYTDAFERFATLVAAAAKAEENDELRQGLARMAALYEKAANDRDALFEKLIVSKLKEKNHG